MDAFNFDRESFRRNASVSDEIKGSYYPEFFAGGFTSVDGTIEFYTRINALLSPEFDLLDFGAGRAAWFHNDRTAYRRKLRDMRGKVSSVTACDVDKIVLQNPVSDKQVLCALGSPLPFDDESFDIVVADWVFEHLDTPGTLAAELMRVLRPGGWICARTPNCAGYIALATRMINNRFHSTILKKVQPERLEEDVFPTRFLLNSMSDIKKFFPQSSVENHSYYHTAEPGYFFNKKIIFGFFKAVNYLLPHYFSANIHVFVCKNKQG